MIMTKRHDQGLALLLLTTMLLIEACSAADFSSSSLDSDMPICFSGETIAFQVLPERFTRDQKVSIDIRWELSALVSEPQVQLTSSDGKTTVQIGLEQASSTDQFVYTQTLINPLGAGVTPGWVDTVARGSLFSGCVNRPVATSGFQLD
jgi:hypothetical protein